MNAPPYILHPSVSYHLNIINRGSESIIRFLKIHLSVLDYMTQKYHVLIAYRFHLGTRGKAHIPIFSNLE